MFDQLNRNTSLKSVFGENINCARDRIHCDNSFEVTPCRITCTVTPQVGVFETVRQSVSYRATMCSLPCQKSGSVDIRMANKIRANAYALPNICDSLTKILKFPFIDFAIDELAT